MKTKCPTCNQSVNWDQIKNQHNKLPEWFPFCSLRCKLIDLGKWFDENYKIDKNSENDDNY